MQKPTDDRLIVHAQPGQNFGHGDGMDEIRLSAFAQLSVVESFRRIKSSADQFGVVIFIDTGNLF